MVNNDTRSVYITSSMLRDVVLVAVPTGSPASQGIFVLDNNLLFVRTGNKCLPDQWLPNPTLKDRRITLQSSVHV